MARLRIETGEDRGTTYPFGGKLLTLGRDPSNHIVLSDDQASRYHAKVVCKDGSYFVTDLNSTNGTHLNGSKVRESVLGDGDVIVIGKKVLLFELKDDEEEEAVAPVPEKEEQAFVDSVVLVAEEKDSDAGIDIQMEVTSDEARAMRDSALARAGEESEIADERKKLLLIYEIANMIASVLDSSEMLERIVNMIFGVISAECAFIILQDPETDEFVVSAGKRRESAIQRHGQEVFISKTMIKHVMASGTGVLTSNAMSDSRFVSSASIAKLRIMSAMCVPIKGASTPLGVIHVYSDKATTEFTRDDLEMLAAIGNELGLALENLRLIAANIEAERLAGIGQVVTGLAHYIKNILTYLKVATTVIEDGLKASDINMVEQVWPSVRKGVEKISQLSLDMLHYSKERRPHLVLANVDSIIMGATEPIIQTLPGINIVTDLTIGKMEHWIDPDGLHRALLNILVNASEAVERVTNGSLKISSCIDDESGWVKISISDNGPGIPEEAIDNIFDVFFSTKGSKGTGLGLAVSNQIVELLGGKIEVVTSPKTGTSFIIHLPSKAETPTSTDL
ncbi:ATP-binding protein [Candidatus Hydrogenedentota bacterium]